MPFGELFFFFLKNRVLNSFFLEVTYVIKKKTMIYLSFEHCRQQLY